MADQVAEQADSEGRWRRTRRRIAANPVLNLGYRIGVGVVGLLVLSVGIVLIPYPGPGWVIVFAGLGILATEFAWAHRLLRFAKAKYRAFMEWFLQQHIAIKTLSAILTTIVVLVTLWVLGTFGLVGGWFGFDSDLLDSPL